MSTKRFPDRFNRQIKQARSKRVRSLKTKISSGKYRIPNSSIAKALFFAW